MVGVKSVVTEEQKNFILNNVQILSVPKLHQKLQKEFGYKRTTMNLYRFLESEHIEYKKVRTGSKRIHDHEVIKNRVLEIQKAAAEKDYLTPMAEICRILKISDNTLYRIARAYPDELHFPTRSELAEHARNKSKKTELAKKVKLEKKVKTDFVLTIDVNRRKKIIDILVSSLQKLDQIVVSDLKELIKQKDPDLILTTSKSYLHELLSDLAINKYFKKIKRYKEEMIFKYVKDLHTNEIFEEIEEEVVAAATAGEAKIKTGFCNYMRKNRGFCLGESELFTIKEIKIIEIVAGFPVEMEEERFVCSNCLKNLMNEGEGK